MEGGTSLCRVKLGLGSRITEEYVSSHLAGTDTLNVQYLLDPVFCCADTALSLC